MAAYLQKKTQISHAKPNEVFLAHVTLQWVQFVIVKKRDRILGQSCKQIGTPNLKAILTTLEVFLINVKVVFFRVAFLHSENAVGNKKAVAEGEY